MYEIAEQVARWLADGEQVRIGQIVETRGFSSRDPAAALAWTGGGDTAGALVPGLDVDVPADADGLIEITITDDAAVASGLSCGGQARVLVRDAAAYPAGLWDRLQRHEPVCAVHSVGDGRTEVFSPANVRDATQFAGDIPRLFARGTSTTAVLEVDVAVVALWPPTTLVVVGDGTIAAALAGVAELLTWTPRVINDAESAAAAAAKLTESDAAVVLSHDRGVDVPALAAVLASRCGYVGALGARRTQAARRDGLIALGVDTDTLARIHGPAGLDIDAHTPGEIAVSIAGEILAARSGASGGSISNRDGPVHTGGVHAPPPRY